MRVPSVIMAGYGAGPQASEFLQVQTTTDSRVEAMELVRAAVESRLAACGQVAGPVASTYWWNDEVERSEEWFVFFKTTAGRYEQLAAFLLERHSYDEPEIIAVPIVRGSAAYLAWLRDETSESAADSAADNSAADSGVPAPRLAEGGVPVGGEPHSD
jgi:periplasmic divalent cation tolerance protein